MGALYCYYLLVHSDFVRFTCGVLRVLVLTCFFVDLVTDFGGSLVQVGWWALVLTCIVAYFAFILMSWWMFDVVMLKHVDWYVAFVAYGFTYSIYCSFSFFIRIYLILMGFSYVIYTHVVGFDKIVCCDLAFTRSLSCCMLSECVMLLGMSDVDCFGLLYNLFDFVWVRHYLWLFVLLRAVKGVGRYCAVGDLHLSLREDFACAYCDAAGWYNFVIWGVMWCDFGLNSSSFSVSLLLGLWFWRTYCKLFCIVKLAVLAQEFAVAYFIVIRIFGVMFDECVFGMVRYVIGLSAVVVDLIKFLNSGRFNLIIAVTVGLMRCFVLSGVGARALDRIGVSMHYAMLYLGVECSWLHVLAEGCAVCLANAACCFEFSVYSMTLVLLHYFVLLFDLYVLSSTFCFADFVLLVMCILVGCAWTDGLVAGSWCNRITSLFGFDRPVCYVLNFVCCLVVNVHFHGCLLVGGTCLIRIARYAVVICSLCVLGLTVGSALGYYSDAYLTLLLNFNWI
eukprot:gene2724-1709_t